METTCFLSFIVPVYNAQEYLEACLDSLLTQDLPREEYEIVCVNDGSTDGSAEILKRYQGLHKNIRVLHQENSGVATARNNGLFAAQGEFIWFIDSDDFIKHNILAGLKQECHARHCDRLVIDGYTFWDELTPQEQRQSQENTLPGNMGWYDSTACRNLLRRSFLKENDLYFRYPEVTHGEDGLFMYEVASFCKHMVIDPQICYFYRNHHGSAETSLRPEIRARKISSYIKVIEVLNTYYSQGRKDEFTANKLMTMLWLSLYEIAKLPAKSAGNAIDQLKALQMFPIQMLPECTLTSSYIVPAEGLAGKILDKICLRLHTRWGYAVIRMLHQLLRLKRSLFS